MSAWTKLEPVAGGKTVCPVCQCGAHESLDPERRVAVGFGQVQILRDGEVVWSEGNREYEQCPTVHDVELNAAANPDHDWRIRYYAPLYEATYQRHGPGHWVLVEKGPGFA